MSFRIFIVEGCLTMAIGLICCLSNISRPATAGFLTTEEKEMIALSVEARTTTIGIVAEWKAFFSKILNYIWASLYILTSTTTYSVAIFAPTFVQAFHPDYDAPAVQGQVVPIFVVSAAACLLTAWLADRMVSSIKAFRISFIFLHTLRPLLHQSHGSAFSLAVQLHSTELLAHFCAQDEPSADPRLIP